MAATTKIEWAANADGSKGASWNPVRALYRLDGIDHAPTEHKVGFHCVHASEGCRNCYAETLNRRGLPGAGTGLAYTKQNEAKVHIFLDEERLAAPLKRWKPTTWFLSSMSDVFADFVTDAMLDRLFAVMARARRHTFIILTKRAKRMREFLSRLHRAVVAWFWRMQEGDELAPGSDRLDRDFPETFAALRAASRKPGHEWKDWPLPNVWLGVSAEDQKTFDERAAELVATPSAVRLVSLEPLLGPIDARSGRNYLEPFETDNNGPILPGLDWVIVGGESGAGARPMHPAWARSLRDQCAAAGVPFFFKQWGEWKEWRHDEDGPHVEIIDTDEKAEATAAILARLSHPVGCVTQSGRAYATMEAWASSNENDPVRVMERLGKARAGRLLDGVEHNARPPLSTTSKGEALATDAASPGRSLL